MTDQRSSDKMEVFTMQTQQKFVGLEDVLKICLEDVLKTCLEDVLKTCLEDIMETSKILNGDICI